MLSGWVFDIQESVFLIIEVGLGSLASLPMTHGLRIFGVLEPKFSSFRSCAWNGPSKLASEGCVYFLKLCTMCQPEKMGTVSPSSDTGTTHLTLVKVPCCQLTYVLHVFKHCDLLVLKIIIL